MCSENLGFGATGEDCQEWKPSVQGQKFKCNQTQTSPIIHYDPVIQILHGQATFDFLKLRLLRLIMTNFHTFMYLSILFYFLQKVERFRRYLLVTARTHIKTNRRTDEHGDSCIPLPRTLLCGGIKKNASDCNSAVKDKFVCVNIVCLDVSYVSLIETYAPRAELRRGAQRSHYYY